jgi:hypothetical protein
LHVSVPPRFAAGQHGWLRPPHVWQVPLPPPPPPPPLQARPLLQVPPQQGWPEPPQAWQVAFPPPAAPPAPVRIVMQVNPVSQVPKPPPPQQL